LQIKHPLSAVQHVDYDWNLGLNW